jgi:hypothetical protein
MNNKPEKMKVPTNVLVDVMKYLVGRPYSEVYLLIQALEKNAEPANNQQSEKDSNEL